MLAKNQTSALIMSVTLIATGLFGYWILTEPLYPLSEIFQSWFDVVLSVVLLFGMAILTSRTTIIDMDEDAFGWQGLVRWAMLGFLTGLLISLIYKFGYSRVQDILLLETFFRIVLPALVGILLFWLIFRRNPFSSKRSVTRGGPSIANMRWVLMIGGIAIVIIGFAFIILYAHGKTKPVLLGIGLVMLGWCAVLSGAMTHRGRHDGLERRLSGFTSVLTLIALAMILAGMLWT